MSGNSNAPRVTVLMAVHNGERWLSEAVQSILGQTFHDFEFLIIDDGSTDASLEIVTQFADERIRLIRNEQNCGLAASLNRGMALASGEYVARMDCDDVSLPRRLEKQVSFLDANPEIAVCGSRVRTIGRAIEEVWLYPLEPDVIRCQLLFENALAHPSVMLRRKIFDSYRLSYDQTFPCSQDYDLWVRTARHAPLANVDDVLLFYRLHEDQAGCRLLKIQSAATRRIREALLAELGLHPSVAESELHEAISEWRFVASREFVQAAGRWLGRLQQANTRRSAYPEPAFSRMLASRWFRICGAAASLGLWSFREYRRSPLAWLGGEGWREKVGFLARCALVRSERCPQAP